MNRLIFIVILCFSFSVSQQSLAGHGKAAVVSKFKVKELHDDAVSFGPKTRRGALARLELARLRLAGDIENDILTPQLALLMIVPVLNNFDTGRELGIQARNLLREMREQNWIDDAEFARYNPLPAVPNQQTAVAEPDEESAKEPQSKRLKEGDEAEEKDSSAPNSNEQTEPVVAIPSGVATQALLDMPQVAMEHDFLEFDDPLFGLDPHEDPENLHRVATWDDDFAPFVPELFIFDEDPLPPLTDDLFENPPELQATPGAPVFNFLGQNAIAAAEAAIRQAAQNILPVVAAAVPVLAEAVQTSAKKRRNGDK